MTHNPPNTTPDGDEALRKEVLGKIELAVRTEFFVKYQKNMQFLADDIMSLISAHTEAKEEQHFETYKWLLGLSGDFPSSQPGARYNWRPELRKRLPEVMLDRLAQPPKEGLS